MSSVPPNIVGPILQSNLAQRQASGIRDNEEAQKFDAERRRAAAAAQNDGTVNTEDQDMQVDADTEGSGSQGRAFTTGEEHPESSEEDQQRREPVGDEGHNIDFTA